MDSVFYWFCFVLFWVLKEGETQSCVGKQMGLRGGMGGERIDQNTLPEILKNKSIKSMKYRGMVGRF